MNIGIDIDDTISNTFETFLPYMKKFAEQDLNRKLDLNLSSRTDYYNIIEKYGISEEEARTFWVNYYVEILENVQPRKSAVEVINTLKEKGHKIFLITARVDDGIVDVKAITEKWLEVNKINYDKLIINSHTTLNTLNKSPKKGFFPSSITLSLKITLT